MPFYEDFIDAAQSDCLGAPYFTFLFRLIQPGPALVMSQETYRAKELTEDLWLVEGSCQLRADSSYKVYLQEYQRCTFIFTVKKRLSQLYHRFGVTNRTSLIHKFKGKA